MSASKKKKVILIGMDGLMPELIERYRDEIPQLKKFLGQGFFAPAYPSPYTCTATNWPTIATGAWVGTHGCTSFQAHLPGMELGESVPTFNSELCQAEYFWHAAERQGKRSILINYPTAFPKLLKNGVVIGGDGLLSSAWTVRWNEIFDSEPEKHSSQDRDKAKYVRKIMLRPAGDWQNVPDNYKVMREGVVSLQGQASFTWDAAGYKEAEEMIADREEYRYFLIFRESGETRLLISPCRDAAKALTVLCKGQWSGWVRECFDGRPCMRQYKLMQLNENGTRVSIYGTMAGAMEGWGYPRGVEKRVLNHVGAYLEALELEGLHQVRSSGFGDMSLEIMKIQAHWMSDCAAYMNRTQDWDSMFIQYHAPDGMSHAFLRDLESEDEATRSASDHMIRETVRILFKMTNKIISSCTDENTVVCIVSDHGNLPKTKCVFVDGVLSRKEWLIIKSFRDDGSPVIDTRRSRVVAGQHGVWINMKGREKYGCVNPGQEYERLRSEIIDVLMNIRDPETKECPFALIGRREDFHGMGMWGERIEDIVYFPKTYYLPYWFRTAEDLFKSRREIFLLEEIIEKGLIWNLCAAHWGLPEASAGYASNRAVFMLCGPGVKRNAKGNKRVNLVDVTPTLAHCLNIRPPRQCEGRIVWEAFES